MASKGISWWSLMCERNLLPYCSFVGIFYTLEVTWALEGLSGRTAVGGWNWEKCLARTDKNKMCCLNLISFRDYSKSRNQRYSSPEAAAKNRIVAPVNALHWFNAPPDMTEEGIAEVGFIFHSVFLAFFFYFLCFWEASFFSVCWISWLAFGKIFSYDLFRLFFFFV